MKRIVYIVLAIFLLIFSYVYAQQQQFVIKIAKFTSDILSNEELTTLEKIVASYVAELGQFRIIDSRGQEIALTEIENSLAMGNSVQPQILSAHYIITMHIGKINQSYAITIDIVKTATGEKRTKTEIVSSLNEILLTIRPMLYSLMGIQAVSTTQSVPTEAAEYNFKSTIAVSDIVGIWKGDRGIETVRLYGDKTGIVVLTSGKTFKVKYQIINDTLIVEQNQKNFPEMYVTQTITLATAKIIAQKARPQKWIFKLSESGQMLIGIKESIYVTGSGNSITVDNTYVREAVWSKLK